MAALGLALKQAVDGRGQVVGIVGEPGVGKSRLCFEFTERCRARSVPIYEAHCPAHGKTLPFLPMLELLRSYFGITDADSDEAARKKIAGTLVLADPAFQEVLPLVFDFLGVPDPEHPAPRIDPEARQRQLFAFMRRLLQTRSRDAAILLLDDVHWIDPASDGFLAQLADVVPGTHFLLLLNFRPEYRAAWMGKSSYQQLPLYPLGPEAAAQLLSELLGSDPSVGALAERIGQRTGGNPFFIEEVVRALEEDGRLTGVKGAYRLAAPVDEITIPATVQAVLAARIDRLGEREKMVLQAAAVIGKEFSEPVLQRVISDVGAHGRAPSDLTAALAALKKMEFVYEQALYPVAEYVFKHPLTQEVAYHSLLSERRARTHAAVARALETHERGEFGEKAAVIAYHWESAGDRVQAGRWHACAAKWAEASSSAEAARHWKRVCELLGDADAPDLVELALVACASLLSTGAATGLEDAEAVAIFAEGMQLARRFPNANAESRLVAAHGVYLVYRGAAYDALQSVEEAVQRAGESGDPNLYLGALAALALTHLNLGRLLPALAASDQAVPLFAAAPQEIAANALILRGLLLTLAGQLQPAAESLYRAEQLIPAGNDVLIGIHTSNLAYFALQRGDAHAALSHAHRALDYAGRTSSPTFASYAHWVRGEAQNLLGDFEGALRSFEQALATGAMLNLEGYFVAGLAAAHLGLGDHDRARLTAEHAIEVARQRGHAISECSAQLTLARVLAHVDGATAAAAIEAVLQEGERLIAATGARIYSPRLYEERARLAGVRGDAAGRERELRAALRLYAEMGATGHAERIESLLH